MSTWVRLKADATHQDVVSGFRRPGRYVVSGFSRTGTFSGGHMRTRQLAAGGLLLVGVFGTAHIGAQDPADEIRMATMRPVIRGRTQAAASMKPQATRAAAPILQAAGHPFAPP